MHVHGNQFDPNLQLSALYAASALAGEYEEAAVVSLSGDDAQQEQPEQQEQDSAEEVFSDWA